MLWSYLRMLGRRAFRWGLGAAVTLLFFVVAAVAGAPEWGIIVAGVIGALLGSVLAYQLMQRLFGPEPVAPPRQNEPRQRRGSGRRGS